ncbi:MAG: DNA-processing protein DprA [Thiotrichaceae bacterium]|nr:DNA-processing protein DprA [Thiotrichaceae bacterium]
MKDPEYWLALAHAPRNLGSLLNHFGSPRHLFEAGPLEWRVHCADVIKYLQKPNWYAVENDIQWLAQTGNHLITLDHSDYPPFLREIYDPPPVLFVRGDTLLLKSPQLAIVGTRSASSEGEWTARTFAENLSNQGLTITSGLVFGIEGASHWGALAGQGKTIAVAGWGLDQIYPAEHSELTQKIVETGTIISELPPGTQIKRMHFRSRSRIISGLSLGTLLIEAPEYSGALDTVRFAIEQGREVFVIPGSIHNPLVKGCHQLIKEGAKLVENVNDILEELQNYHYIEAQH